MASTQWGSRMQRKNQNQPRLTKAGKRLIAALSEVLDDLAGRKLLPVVASDTQTQNQSQG
jgi:hypothetical protein